MLDQQIMRLFATIESRRCADPQKSWTAKLMQGGTIAISKKLAEECTELALAARELELFADVYDKAQVDASDKRVKLQHQATGEAADVLYHYLVLLAQVGIDPQHVAEQLNARGGQSGIEEKNNRQS